MDRIKYNECIASGLKGKQFSKEARRLEFCILAKTCSGKALNREQATLICKETAMTPKPASSKSTGKVKAQSCEKEVLQLAQCIADRIDMKLASNINSIEIAIANAMIDCKCQK